MILVPGVGARTVFALALVAEVVHGAPNRFTDPLVSPWPRRKGSTSIPCAAESLRRDDQGAEDSGAKERSSDATKCSRRLSGSTARPGASKAGTEAPPVADIIAEERRLSHSFAGRSVFGWEPAPEGPANES